MNSIKPKVQTEFDRVRADMCEMRMEMRSVHKSLEEMQYQMASVFKLCKEVNSRNQRIQKPPHFCDIYEKDTDDNSSGENSDTDTGRHGNLDTNSSLDPSIPSISFSAPHPTPFSTNAPLNSTPLTAPSTTKSNPSEKQTIASQFI